MKNILSLFIGIVFTGIAVLLCLLLCVLAGKSDEFWEKKKQELEKKNERR